MKTNTLDWNYYTKIARQTAADGCVLLENRNDVLPFPAGTRLAVFGRIQNHYYKSGTGSGGLVNTEKVAGIPEALAESGRVVIDRTLADVYRDWEQENPYEEGVGWGMEPWSQKEMPVTVDLAGAAASRTDAALVIIGRTAGEDKDNQLTPGSYLLTEEELSLLAAVRGSFAKMAVVLNTGNIIDMSFVDTIQPDAVLYVWQGGMTGGYAVADILTGAVNPSGKLTDTVAYEIEDYPAARNFGDAVQDIYEEDIFVGYRYFETAAKNRVRYPFGYGLSYTAFSVQAGGFSSAVSGGNLPVVSLNAAVTNTGTRPGREVVQIYAGIPQGKLGKPLKTLAAFAKTGLLQPGETETLHFTVALESLASFDDTGCTGHKNCMIAEAGAYTFYVGTDVRSCTVAGEIHLEHDTVTAHLHEALAPVIPVRRLKARQRGNDVVLEPEDFAPVGHVQQLHRNEALPAVQKTYAFAAQNAGGTAANNGAFESFLQNILPQLTDNDLACIIRGEGMGSPRVTAGTAAAFGGVSARLQSLGIPCACCTDGPSGLRLDSGAQAFSLPNGTLQACTFDPALIEELYYCLGLEMAANKIDIILGPGMNIHRHPLNGRNFEYFSEDPYVTGKCAAATIRGLHRAGVSGSLKHFCCNNQEYSRWEINSVVTPRALREIYLKGFEMAVKEAGADVVMTTYGAVNGIWTASSYDLNTLILRGEWGFSGIVMTDWWAMTNDEGAKPGHGNFAAMVRAQNDLYMVCSDAETNQDGDNTLESLKNGTLDRAELLRSAANIIRFLFASRAKQRLDGTCPPVSIVNRPAGPAETDADDIIYYKLDRELTVPLDGVKCTKGSSFTFALDCMSAPAEYEVTFTAKTGAGALAQLPVSIAANGIHVGTFTWNGTDGAWETKSQAFRIGSRYTVVRMYFAQSGLTLRDMTYSFVRTITRDEII